MDSPNFSWSEKKRQANLAKHGIDFKDVAAAFAGPSIDIYDAEHSESEERWRRLLWLNGEVVVVVYAEFGEAVRLISARPGNREETQVYLDQFLGDTAD